MEYPLIVMMRVEMLFGVYYVCVLVQSHFVLY